MGRSRSRSRSPSRRRGRDEGGRERSRDKEKRSKEKDKRSKSRSRDREKRDDRHKSGGDRERGERDRSAKRERGSPRRREPDDKERHGSERKRAASPSSVKPEVERPEVKVEKPEVKDELGPTAEALPQPPQKPQQPQRVEPLSLEELLKKKKALEEDAAKPRFISKKEREAIALQRRELEVALASHKGGGRGGGGIAGGGTSQAPGLDEVLRRVQSIAAAATAASAGNGGGGAPLPPPPVLPPPPGADGRDRDRGDRGGRDDRDRDRDRDRMPPPSRGGGREWDRERERDDRDRDRGRDSGGRGGDRNREPERNRDAARGDGRGGGAGTNAEREKARELELIKQQYLGAEKKRKKVQKATDKFRFNFDWDAGEDTSKDLNPLYANTHEAALMFGRGMRAGIDPREQKKQLVEQEKEARRLAMAKSGIVETTEMRAMQAAKDKRMDEFEGYGMKLAVQAAKDKRMDEFEGFGMKVEKHWTEKAVEKMSERDWRIFREDYNISYKGNPGIMPIRNWDEAGLPKELVKAIDKVGYKKPSPIQMAAIPLGLKGRDVIGVAETGSGKTAAFMLPMLAYILKQAPMDEAYILKQPPMDEVRCADGPYAVVLAPTRELAQQIEEDAIKLAQFCGFKTISIVGGQSIEEQGAKLRRGCEIVIATPGRLLDCLEKCYAVLNQCNYIVLDEADRMIDLGFEPQVNSVMDAMPSANLKPEEEDAKLEEDRVYRTTYMFSATMPAAVERLARKYMRKVIVVNIGRAGQATENVTQKVLWVKENEKASRLDQELHLVPDKRAIVFVNTKRQCDNVFNQLEAGGHNCTVGGRFPSWVSFFYSTESAN
ncbi:hypothetical protein FOA52_008297 [Chlamydomonas sp. UWO 241]|nr:hypothetical protein FOA52_008297 [Chlamydomonas sp. UWO 241]